MTSRPQQETTRPRRATARPLAVGALCAAALATPAAATAVAIAATPPSAARPAAAAIPMAAPPAAAPAGPAAAAIAPAATLPAPTGSAPVGRRTLHLTDRARRDPFASGRRARELGVTLWYPAQSRRGRPATYVSPALARLLAEDGMSGAATIATNAIEDARPAPGRRPLVLFSPGYGMSRLSFQQLGEELASRGYVVAAVDHTYEAPWSSWAAVAPSAGR